MCIRDRYQYYYWLNKIPESDKAELLDLKQSKQRIAKIRSIVEEQIYNNFELQLPKQDFEIIKLMLLRTVPVREKRLSRSFWTRLGLKDMQKLAGWRKSRKTCPPKCVTFTQQACY